MGPESHNGGVFLREQKGDTREASEGRAHRSDAKGHSPTLQQTPGAACSGFPLSPPEDHGARTLLSDSRPLGLCVTG